MNKRGEAFLTKAGVGIALMSMFIGLITIFMSGLATDYSRNIESSYQDNFNAITSDLTEIEKEAQQIQKGSGLDSQASDLAQAQGVLSASEKKADSQTILMETINSIRDILPFDDFVYKGLLLILGAIFLSALIYVVLGRWI
jgi:hypothetical protein